MKLCIIKAENKITGEVISNSNVKIVKSKAEKLTRQWNQDDPKNKYYTIPAQ